MKCSLSSVTLTLAILAAPAQSEPIRTYSRLLDPREHPDYERRAVKPPSWDTFGGETQFTSVRGFNVQDGRIVEYEAELEKFTRTHGLGNVIWPSYPILFAKNLGEFAAEIQRRGLYLFDVWGYVPGSGPGGYWQQFRPPSAAFGVLEATLGERWLGTDIGEQDGRYIGGYADQMTPASARREEQYLNFQRHFERMSDDLGHRHAVLVSLNFGHYLLKEGTFTLIGAETAQALPNNEVYYAFIRGAGKQYGVPWFGNASIYNRWGFKSYGGSGRSDGADYGPTKGSSLSLLKRLLYSHLLYNSLLVGFENGWLNGDALTPIGRLQQAAQRWVHEHGQPGVMHTPVALLLDFHAGWTFPRHLYSDKVYRVWGNLPYQPGDHLTDAILDLLYPGYQDSSYYHDESGFIAPTPYGDIADCLLSDVPGWLLARYPVVVAAGELAGGREIRDKLEAYLRGGGHLILTAANLARLPGGLGGHTRVTRSGSTRVGRGRLTLVASAFGIHRTAFRGPLRSDVDRPLPKLCALDDDLRRALDTEFRAQRLFEVSGSGLSYITCRKAPGEYTLGIANNSWHASPFRIVSRCGPLASIRELPLDTSEKQAVGYLPEAVDPAHPGVGGEGRISGGDVRVFAVKVSETGVEEIPPLAPPPRPTGRWLTLRHPPSIRQAILERPTFFEHFDGVVLDWAYLHEREPAALRAEAGWINRQGLRVAVDLSSGINLYPTLRLVDNLPDDYAASMAAVRDVLAKMQVLGARDLILSLHRHPENNFTDEQTRSSFVKTLKDVAAEARPQRITVHLRLAPAKPPWSLAEAAALIDRTAAPNLKLAPALSLVLDRGEKLEQAGPLLRGKVGLWLCAAPRRDEAGKLYDAHAPLHVESPGMLAETGKWLRLAAEAPCVLDAVLDTSDEEYLDATTLANLAGGSGSPGETRLEPRP